MIDSLISNPQNFADRFCNRIIDVMSTFCRITGLCTYGELNFLIFGIIFPTFFISYLIISFCYLNNYRNKWILLFTKVINISVLIFAGICLFFVIWRKFLWFWPLHSWVSVCQRLLLRKSASQRTLQSCRQSHLKTIQSLLSITRNVVIQLPLTLKTLRVRPSILLSTVRNRL